MRNIEILKIRNLAHKLLTIGAPLQHFIYCRYRANQIASLVRDGRGEGQWTEAASPLKEAALHRLDYSAAGLMFRPKRKARL
jgi:hypothetical protein